MTSSVCTLTPCNLVITHSQWSFICCYNKANAKQFFWSISFGETFPYLWLIGAKVTQPDAKFRICFRSFWEVFDQFVATTIQPFVEIFKRKLVHSGNFLRSRRWDWAKRAFSNKCSATSPEYKVINFPQNIHNKRQSEIVKLSKYLICLFNICVKMCKSYLCNICAVFVWYLKSVCMSTWHGCRLTQKLIMDPVSWDSVSPSLHHTKQNMLSRLLQFGNIQVNYLVLFW